MTADDSLLTDVDAFEISGPPGRAAGRWDGGIGPGAYRSIFRPRGAHRATSSLSAVNHDQTTTTEEA
jgi:hypothetical protein